MGRHLVRVFERRDCQLSAPSSQEYDLTKQGDTVRMFEAFKPNVVVHAAADVGGIEYNRRYPADIFRNNLQMTTNILEGSYRAGVEKLVVINSTAAYPGNISEHFKEEWLFQGAMHPSDAFYGISKCALYLGTKAYHQQFGLRSITLVLTNLYGPGDRFDEEAHVIPSLIRKFIEASENGDDQVSCWGTGNAVREFLHVEDCAEAVVRATEDYDDIEPLNIGDGNGVNIRELATLIGEVCGFKGEIVWDTSKPDGALYRVMDISKMHAVLDWRPKMSLKVGLPGVVESFRASRDQEHTLGRHDD